MQRHYKYIFLLILPLVSSCAIFQDREPEPESWNDVQDFYDSLLTELAYSPEQKRLIEYGRSLLGTPYRDGGNNPNEGFDCSGFTRYVYYNALKIKIPRTSRQLANTGRVVRNTADLQAGDLVFFNLEGGRYSHVGIYIGNGRFFHASTNKRKIVIGNLKHEYFAKRYNGARRILS